MKRGFLSILLTVLIGLDLPIARTWAQAAPKLKLVIVEGEGAVNNIRTRVAREPIVQVTDENDKPLAGASVVFLLPNQGASATFANGSKMLTVMTDETGRAAARGMMPNKVTGQVQMRVTASYRGESASTTINMTNAAVAGAAAGGAAGAGKLIAILAVVGGAAAAGGIVAATRGNGNGNSPGPGSTPNPGTSITPGSPTVGPPR